MPNNVINVLPESLTDTQSMSHPMANAQLEITQKLQNSART